MILKKKWLILAGFALLSLGNNSISLAAPIPLRGVIEGFYGTPWQEKERQDILAFCKNKGFNAYIYAPKDDPYHRAKWREPYPPTKLLALQELINTAKANKVKFVFAISPGLDINFGGDKAIADRASMKNKLETMYALGVRDFAIFFDDIKDKNGVKQAEFLNWVDDNFVKKHQGVSPLITVPTEYFRFDMQADDRIKPYTSDFANTLNKDIIVLYTGNGVVCDGISDADYQKANEVYGRNLGIWWNYPVTDYMENKLALGPIEKLPTKSNIPAIFFNPMKYEKLSKIALATGADYAKTPENYDAVKSWQQAINEQYPDLSAEMKLFASQSQHLENNWAKVGPPDDSELTKLAKAYLQKKAAGIPCAGEKKRLQERLQAIVRASQTLQDKLPNAVLKECSPQLMQLERIASADLMGLAILEKTDDNAASRELQAAYQEFNQQYKIIKAKEKAAIISEKAAMMLLEKIHADIADRN